MPECADSGSPSFDQLKLELQVSAVDRFEKLRKAYLAFDAQVHPQKKHSGLELIQVQFTGPDRVFEHVSFESRFPFSVLLSCYGEAGDQIYNYHLSQVDAHGNNPLLSNLTTEEGLIVMTGIIEYGRRQLQQGAADVIVRTG